MTALVLCLQLAQTPHSFASESVFDATSELLRQKIESWKAPPEPEDPPVETPLPLPATTNLNLEEASAPAAAASEDQNGALPPAAAPAMSSEPPSQVFPPKPPPPKPKLMVGNEVLRTAPLLARFYEERGYCPAWSNEAGLLPQAEALLDTIQIEAEREGLRPGDYRLAKVRQLLQETQSPPPTAQTLADLDLLLTDTFLLYGANVSIGENNFDAMSPQWFEKRQKMDLVQELQKAVDMGLIVETLTTLPPPHEGYKKLRSALAQYRALAARGGWPQVPLGYDLHPGEHDPRVPTLRARMQATGELTSAPQRLSVLTRPSVQSKKIQKNTQEENNLYDPALVQAVKRFQRRHGIEADGVVGGRTLAALNVSVATRIQQLIANMNRWRALPQELGVRYVAVNIPNFTLEVIENEEAVLRMKVVVGKMVEKRNTPTFAATMTHVVLNPYWHVPKSIAEKELFPLLRKDPQYFSKNKFIVRRVEVGEKQAPDPNATDGSMSSTKIYQYVLKQAPGPKNALGRIKFMFPNPYGVYLHDTPSKDLFNRTVRTYSHGCIRVERAVDLAEYLLRGVSPWTRDAILSTIEQEKEKTIWLQEPVPVYIQYWTAWVDKEGVLQFRNDIYGYDKAPGAMLPVTVAKNPRPQPMPEIRLEVQPETLLPPSTEPRSPSPVETQPIL